jgi:hypothetical protein
MDDITGFVFHKSYWDAISNLPDEVSKCKVIESICNYVFSNIEPELTGIENSIWILIKPTLDSSTKRYKASVENGKKGGRPKKTQEKPNNNLTETQDKSQVKPNQNLNKDKDKDIDKDMVVVVPVELQMLMKMFNTSQYSTTTVKELWDMLNSEDKKFAFERADEYVKWEQSRGKKKLNLEFYLKDKKWGWDLIIKKEKDKIDLTDVPKPYTDEWYKWRQERGSMYGKPEKKI